MNEGTIERGSNGLVKCGEIKLGNLPVRSGMSLAATMPVTSARAMQGTPGQKFTKSSGNSGYHAGGKK